MADNFPLPADSDQRIPVPADALRPLLEQMLTRMSLFQFDAATAVQRLLEADLYGHPAHGCARFPTLLDAIDLGDVDPRGRVLTVTDAPAFAVLDGSRSLGEVAGTKGAELAAAKALDSGVAVVVVGNSQPLGAAEIFVRLMTQQGLIGICFTSSGTATIAPPGMTIAAGGNIQLAYGLPTEGPSPVIFGSSSGTGSWPRAALLKQCGLPCPAEWLADPGDTAEPSAATVFAPLGRELGFGISLLGSVLAGPLAGGRMPLHKKKRPEADDSQHVFLAIHISRFTDPATFHKEVSTTLEEIRVKAGAAPAGVSCIPGDHEAEIFERRQREGIPLPRSVADDLAARARKMKLTVPWP